MVRSKRKEACFGAPADMNESQLPLEIEVGAQFLKTQIDIRAERKTPNVDNNSVAVEVSHALICFTNIFQSCLSKQGHLHGISPLFLVTDQRSLLPFKSLLASFS